MNEAKKEMEATKETIERLSQENDALKKRAVELEAGSKAQSITAVVNTLTLRKSLVILV